MQYCKTLMALGWLFAAAALVWAGGTVEPEPEPPADPDADGTVITSQSLNYDQDARQAVFEGEVVVTDPQLRILTDRLTVFFTEANQVARLQADGSVVIRQGELLATGGRADYDVDEGVIVLSVDPSVRRGRDLLVGETITFWRDTGRILCEPNARLVLYSERDVFTGATAVDDN